VNFDQNERIKLLESDWDTVRLRIENGTLKKKSDAQLYGFAIDAAVKRVLGHAGAVFDKFDLAIPLDNILHQDVKSSRGMSTITISPDEFRFAKNEHANGKDVLYIIFEQLPPDEFRFEGVVLFSDLHHAGLLNSSQFKPGEFFFYINAARRFFLK
jgi:hypothetical protein